MPVVVSAAPTSARVPRQCCTGRNFKAAGLSTLVDLSEATACDIHVVLPDSHQPPPLTSSRLQYLLRLRLERPQATASGLADLLDTFDKHHPAVVHVAAVLRGTDTRDLKGLRQHTHALAGIIKQSHLQRASVVQQEHEGQEVEEGGRAGRPPAKPSSYCQQCRHTRAQRPRYPSSCHPLSQGNRP